MPVTSTTPVASGVQASFAGMTPVIEGLSAHPDEDKRMLGTFLAAVRDGYCNDPGCQRYCRAHPFCQKLRFGA